MKRLILLIIFGLCGFMFYSAGSGVASNDNLDVKVLNESNAEVHENITNHVPFPPQSAPLDSTWNKILVIPYTNSIDTAAFMKYLVNQSNKMLLEGKIEYIEHEYSEEDSSYTWLIDTLKIKADSSNVFSINEPDIMICFDSLVVDSLRKETVLLFPKGVTQNDQYIINEASGWCSAIDILFNPCLLGADTVVVYPFSAIVNFTDPDNAVYLYGHSVCKIEIEY